MVSLNEMCIAVPSADDVFQHMLWYMQAICFQKIQNSLSEWNSQLPCDPRHNGNIFVNKGEKRKLLISDF